MGTRTESGVSQGWSSVASGRLTSEPADLLADELERRGVGAPAAILLDAHRPLLPLIRQGAIFLGPLLGQLLGPRRHGILGQAIHDPATYDRLAARLAAKRPPDQP
jgi:hypothetical protein